MKDVLRGSCDGELAEAQECSVALARMLAFSMTAAQHAALRDAVGDELACDVAMLTRVEHSQDVFAVFVTFAELDGDVAMAGLAVFTAEQLTIIEQLRKLAERIAGAEAVVLH